MSNFDIEGIEELQVTLTFPLTVQLGDLGGRETAAQLHDRWIDEPEALLDVVTDALSDDYDVQVKLFSEP